MPQITKLQTYYGVPGSNLAQFPLALRLAGRQITTLTSCSLPGPRYIFPGSTPLILLLAGISNNNIFWQTNFAGSFFTSKSTQITKLITSSLPGAYVPFKKPFQNYISLTTLVSTKLLWSAPLLGTSLNLQGDNIVPIAFCQQNDVGVILVYQFLDQNGLPINLNGATSLIIKLGYPDSTPQILHTLDRTAALLTDGTDGKVYYVTVGGDLNMVGTYDVQGKFTSGGSTYSGAVVELEVLSNVDNN